MPYCTDLELFAHLIYKNWHTVSSAQSTFLLKLEIVTPWGQWGRQQKLVVDVNIWFKTLWTLPLTLYYVVWRVKETLSNGLYIGLSHVHLLGLKSVTMMATAHYSSPFDSHQTIHHLLWPWRVCICCFCTNLFRCVLPTHVIISHYLCMLSCTKCLLLKGHKVLWVFLVLELLHFSGSLVSHRIVNYILPTVGWTLESV